MVDFRRARLLHSLQNLGVDICCLQENHFIASYYKKILLMMFHYLFVYFDNRSIWAGKLFFECDVFACHCRSGRFDAFTLKEKAFY